MRGKRKGYKVANFRHFPHIIWRMLEYASFLVVQRCNTGPKYPSWLPRLKSPGCTGRIALAIFYISGPIERCRPAGMPGPTILMSPVGSSALEGPARPTIRPDNPPSASRSACPNFPGGRRKRRRKGTAFGANFTKSPQTSATTHFLSLHNRYYLTFPPARPSRPSRRTPSPPCPGAPGRAL